MRREGINQTEGVDLGRRNFLKKAVLGAVVLSGCDRVVEGVGDAISRFPDIDGLKSRRNKDLDIVPDEEIKDNNPVVEEDVEQENIDTDYTGSMRAEFLQRIGNLPGELRRDISKEWGRISLKETNSMYDRRFNHGNDADVYKTFDHLVEDEKFAERLFSACEKASEKYGIPLDIVLGIVGTESEANQFAASASDPSARGVLQLLPRTAEKGMGLKIDKGYGSMRMGEFLGNVLKDGVDVSSGTAGEIKVFLKELKEKIKIKKSKYEDQDVEDDEIVDRLDDYDRKEVAKFFESIDMDDRVKIEEGFAKKDQRFDLEKCVDAGVGYLAKLRKKYGDLGLSLIAYSGGETKMRHRICRKDMDIKCENSKYRMEGGKFYRTFTDKGGDVYRKKVREGRINAVTYYSKEFYFFGEEHSAQYPFYVEEIGQQLMSLRDTGRFIPIADRVAFREQDKDELERGNNNSRIAKK